MRMKWGSAREAINCLGANGTPHKGSINQLMGLSIKNLEKLNNSTPELSNNAKDQIVAVRYDRIVCHKDSSFENTVEVAGEIVPEAYYEQDVNGDYEIEIDGNWVKANLILTDIIGDNKEVVHFVHDDLPEAKLQEMKDYLKANFNRDEFYTDQELVAEGFLPENDDI